MMTDEETREWAARCAHVARGRLAESAAWEQIAENGREFTLAPGWHGPLMRPKQCFNNAARVILGLTKTNPAGLSYAEGFAESSTLGLWFHHAWLVDKDGLAIDRTWRTPGDAYVGVIIDPADFTRPPGCCQLTDWPCSIAMAPSMTASSDDELKKVFRGQL